MLCTATMITTEIQAAISGTFFVINESLNEVHYLLLNMPASPGVFGEVNGKNYRAISGNRTIFIEIPSFLQQRRESPGFAGAFSNFEPSSLRKGVRNFSEGGVEVRTHRLDDDEDRD